MSRILSGYDKGEGRFIFGPRWVATARGAYITDAFTMTPAGGLTTDYYLDDTGAAHNSFLRVPDDAPAALLRGRHDRDRGAQRDRRRLLVSRDTDRQPDDLSGQSHRDDLERTSQRHRAGVARRAAEHQRPLPQRLRERYVLVRSADHHRRHPPGTPVVVAEGGDGAGGGRLHDAAAGGDRRGAERRLRLDQPHAASRGRIRVRQHVSRDGARQLFAVRVAASGRAGRLCVADSTGIRHLQRGRYQQRRRRAGERAGALERDPEQRRLRRQEPVEHDAGEPRGRYARAADARVDRGRRRRPARQRLR